MSSSVKTFLFAFIMCLCCGLLLTVASQGLKDIQAENVQLDRQKNILKAFDLIKTGEKLEKNQMLSLYKNSVIESWVDKEGNIHDEAFESLLPIYLVKSSKGIEKYAVPFSAYGLWSWIKGYVAFEGDGNTIIGFTVYSHAETPGLGGEVDKPWFQNQFKGKKIVNKKGKFVSIGVIKGKVKDVIPKNRRAHYVDGMSGATITGTGIQKYLKIDLEKYESFAKKLRG